MRSPTIDSAPLPGKSKLSTLCSSSPINNWRSSVNHSLSEVNFEEIYLSSQVVNGVATTPPAPTYAVDAVPIHNTSFHAANSTPLNSAELSVLLLNERINRLENILLDSLRTDHHINSINQNSSIEPTAVAGVALEGTNSVSSELVVSSTTSSATQHNIHMHRVEDDMLDMDYIIDSMPSIAHSHSEESAEGSCLTADCS